MGTHRFADCTDRAFPVIVAGRRSKKLGVDQSLEQAQKPFFFAPGLQAADHIADCLTVGVADKIGDKDNGNIGGDGQGGKNHIAFQPGKFIRRGDYRFDGHFIGKVALQAVELAMIIGVILRTEQNDAQLAAAVIDILDPRTDVQGDISDFVFVKLDMGSLKHRNYQVIGGLTGICAYILAMKGTTVDGVYSVTWNRFGPTGIVVAICIGLYVSIIFHLIAKLNLFKNNNTIPEFVQEWIKNIIPIFLSILLLKIVIIDLDVDLYPIVLKLFAPINAIAQTFPGFILLNLFCCFFYSLGISGWTWSGPRNAIFIPAQAANVAAVAAGGTAMYLTTSEVCNGIALICLGGMGCTLALNIWCLFSKSKRLKTLGRVCIAPAIFNINEPILFGTPIVFNPILMMPMWICTTVNATIVWIVMRTGLLAIPTIELAMVATIPAPFSTVMFTGDMRGVIWWAVCLVVDLLIWYPFFKTYEKQEVAKEAAEAPVKA